MYKGDITMKTPIPAIEKVIAERSKSTEENINIRLFWAYKHSLEAGNDLINFYDVIWERDIEGIVENLNYYKINEFSISSNFSGLITILAAFDKYGFTMAGITDAKETYIDLTTNEKTVSKAIRMVRK